MVVSTEFCHPEENHDTQSHSVNLQLQQVACEQGLIWEHMRERQRANSKAKQSFREESGDEARRK